MVRKLYAEKEKNDTLAINPSFHLEEQKPSACLAVRFQEISSHSTSPWPLAPSALDKASLGQASHSSCKNIKKRHILGSSFLECFENLQLQNFLRHTRCSFRVTGPKHLEIGAKSG